MHLEPWQSWAIVGAGVAGAYFYYSRNDNKKRALSKRRMSVPRGTSTDSIRRGSNAKAKGQTKNAIIDVTAGEAAEVSSSAVADKNKSKTRKRKSVKDEPVLTGQRSLPDVTAQGTSDMLDEDLDNKEFAKQLNELKVGSSLAKPDGPKKKARNQDGQAELPPHSSNVQNASINGMSDSKQLSTASSTTGGDADDDLSPATSPPLGASEPTRSGDVTDMLEAPAKGPSVLRLTSVEEPKRQPKSQKVVAEPETKKQRQNKRKTEEKRLVREEAERERKILLEKQLRTAREAEGRPAKNGLAPPSNAWNKSAGGNPKSVPPTTSAPSGPLLDTFERDTTPASSNGSAHESTIINSQKAWQKEVPSEEEQLRLLTEMDGNDGWNTVEKGGKGKRKPVSAVPSKEHERKMSFTSGSASGNEGGQSITSTSDDVAPVEKDKTPLRSIPQDIYDDETPRFNRKKKEEVDPKVWNRSNIHLHPDYDARYPYALTGHPEDSDWAVV